MNGHVKMVALIALYVLVVFFIKCTTINVAFRLHIQDVVFLRRDDAL